MSYFEEGSSAFFSCALTVNVIWPSFLGEISSDEIAHMLFCRYEMSLWALMLFCCTIFVRDVSGWDVMFFGVGGVTTSFACESWCLFGRCSMSWWNDTLFGCRMFLLMVWCKDGGEVCAEGGWRLSVHGGLLDVVWCFVCVSWVVRWRGKWMCECVGSQKGFVWK